MAIPILITVSLVIPNHITLCFVVLSVSLYRVSTQSTYWLRQSLYSSQSPWWYLGYPYTHHSLFGGPQCIPNHITLCFVVLRVSLYRVSTQSTYWLRQSLYSSQSPSWYSDYPFTHHSLPGGTRTIPILITVSLVVLRLSLYPSQSPW